MCAQLYFTGASNLPMTPFCEQKNLRSLNHCVTALWKYSYLLVFVVMKYHVVKGHRLETHKALSREEISRFKAGKFYLLTYRER